MPARCRTIFLGRPSLIWGRCPVERKDILKVLWGWFRGKAVVVYRVAHIGCCDTIWKIKKSSVRGFEVMMCLLPVTSGVFV